MRHWGRLAAGASALIVAGGIAFGATVASAGTASTGTPSAITPAATGGKVIGYYTEWGIYARNYHVKNVQTSGSASKLTHINYAFGNVVNGQCALGDTWADFQRPYDAAGSVDGKAVTAAITADASAGGKMDKADYAGAAQFVNWFNVMTYDFFGAWAPTGPTAPHSPLKSYPGIPTQGFNTDAAITKLKSKGIPSSKLLMGVGFYGRGWSGVTQKQPGGTATGPAPGTWEQGVEDYKVLKTKCPSNGVVAGTAFCFKGGQWWSYDTPQTIASK